MGLKISMAVCMLPLLPILYGAQWYSAMEKNGILYGVTLWEGARESPKVQRIQRSFKRNMRIWALLCFLLFLLTLAPSHDSLVISGQILWIFLAVVFSFIPLVQANRQMMGQKREHQSALPKPEAAGSKVFVDVTAAAARKPRFFRKSLYLGCVFGAMPAVAELFLHRAWHNPQMPDFWDCEVILLVMATAVFLFPLFLFLMERQRIHVVSQDSQVNLQLARVRGYQWSKLCMVMAWVTGGLNWSLLLALHLPSEWFLWVMMGATLLFSLCSMGILCLYCRRLEKASEKYQAAPFFPQDEDGHWIWGIFYYNANDSRAMVEKRVGLGVTGNMANPKIRYGTILTVLAFFLSMMGVCAWSVVEEFTPVSLSYENGTVVARHWKEVYRIERAEIKSVALVRENPDIKRRRGTEMQYVKKGDYYNRADSKDLKVCLAPLNAPFLMIEAEDGTWYLLGSSEEGEAMEVYEELL